MDRDECSGKARPMSEPVCCCRGCGKRWAPRVDVAAIGSRCPECGSQDWGVGLPKFEAVSVGDWKAGLWIAHNTLSLL